MADKLPATIIANKIHGMRLWHIIYENLKKNEAKLLIDDRIGVDCLRQALM